jgi:hypothetical protein
MLNNFFEKKSKWQKFAINKLLPNIVIGGGEEGLWLQKISTIF